MNKIQLITGLRRIIKITSPQFITLNLNIHTLSWLTHAPGYDDRESQC